MQTLHLKVLKFELDYKWKVWDEVLSLIIIKIITHKFNYQLFQRKK